MCSSNQPQDGADSGELKPLLMPVIERLLAKEREIERARLYSVVSRVPMFASAWSYRAHVLAAISAAGDETETPHSYGTPPVAETAAPEDAA